MDGVNAITQRVTQISHQLASLAPPAVAPRSAASFAAALQQATTALPGTNRAAGSAGIKDGVPVDLAGYATAGSHLTP